MVDSAKGDAQSSKNLCTIFLKVGVPFVKSISSSVNKYAWFVVISFRDCKLGPKATSIFLRYVMSNLWPVAASKTGKYSAATRSQSVDILCCKCCLLKKINLDSLT